jgi:hypothetical protein
VKKLNKEQIKEKLLLEKKSRLIDMLEINNNSYAKTLIISESNNSNIKFKYYKIKEDLIEDIDITELEKIKKYFEINLGNVVY